MDLLVEAYLDYCYQDSGNGMPHLDETCAPSPLDILDDTQCVSLSDIELIDIFKQKHSSLQSQPFHKYPNETLIYHSYIGCAPLHPSVTISLQTLAAYCQTHQVCPMFSFQAQCKMLCFLHDIPYHPYLTMQLSAAFDAYVEILHHVDQYLCTALKCDTLHWHLLNLCPACFYVLEDKPKLEFNWLVSINSNNSLKRWDSTIYGTSARLDSCKACSNFWIDSGTVNKFSGEAAPEEGSNWEDDLAVEINPGSFSCADWWKNTGPEVCKNMFLVFNELGIFIAACRHCFILLACDMI
ncbi:hypothetical protein BDR06DRAFT_984879 [Suillus hirtellus]|nr:hypothetical protein BDR06DRAFT_984879 [Suillus hirtellus]